VIAIKGHLDSDKFVTITYYEFHKTSLQTILDVVQHKLTCNTSFCMCPEWVANWLPEKIGVRVIFLLEAVSSSPLRLTAMR